MRALKGSVRRAGGQLIRRAGLLPADQPNGLGEDDQLFGTSLPHTVMVFFADRPNEVYQLAQWYAALRELDKTHRVVVVLQDSRTAKIVRRDAGLDVVVIARNRTMDDILSRSNITVALYINYHPRNYFNLRFTSLVHVHLTHGDSDKKVTISHQITAYDFALVAGQAAVDRLAAYVPFYDASARALPIGRPQLDDWTDRVVGPRKRSFAEASTGLSTASPDEAEGKVPTVLYAPTWAGALPSVSYGSLDTHGVALIDSFLADGWRVIYRPHPLSGVRGGAYKDADLAVRARLEAAGKEAADNEAAAKVAAGNVAAGTEATHTEATHTEATHPGAAPTAACQHRIDTDLPLAESFREADLLVCDISAVAVDWLAVDRPLMLTKPAHADAVIAASPLTRMAPEVTVADLPTIARTARAQVEHDPLAAQRAELIEYYLGDVTPGSATKRFLAAIDHVIAAHDAEQQRLTDAQAQIAAPGFTQPEISQPNSAQPGPTQPGSAQPGPAQPGPPQ